MNVLNCTYKYAYKKIGTITSMIALLQPLSTLQITSMLQALWMSDLLNGWFHV